MSGYYPDQSATPPAPPPKPGSHEASRMATPSTNNSFVPPPPPPLPPQQYPGYNGYSNSSTSTHEPSQLQKMQTMNADGQQATSGGGAVSLQQQFEQEQYQQQQQQVPDPGSGWLPEMLQDKSIQDLATLLATPQLLQSLTHAPQHAHPSLTASHQALSAALASNTQLATQLAELGTRLSHARSATQAQLLSTHALERQWRQRQSDMDHALAPFSPAALYQELAHGVQEQAQVCQAMEDSFLDGGSGGVGQGKGGELLTEREVAEWVKGYRDAKVMYYLRQERKERWDEGRVGGWR